MTVRIPRTVVTRYSARMIIVSLRPGLHVALMIVKMMIVLMISPGPIITVQRLISPIQIQV